MSEKRSGNDVTSGDAQTALPTAPGSGWMPFNINERVRVRLTRDGIHHYYAHHEQFGLLTDGPTIDADGWYEDSLWQVMSIFGEKVNMGGSLMFETEIQLYSQNVEADVRGQRERKK